MSFICLELKQLACTKTGSSVLAKGAKTEKFADSKSPKTEEIQQLVEDEARTRTFHIFIHVHIFMLTMLQYASLFSCLRTHPTTILLSKLFHQSKLS